nr:hypothetical protein [Tanacetum cinerariifolium]
MEVSVQEAETMNGAENKTKNRPIKEDEKEEAVEAPSSQAMEYYLKHRINEKLTKEDVIVEVVEHVYPVDFVILYIKENEKRSFILGTLFLITAKAVIKFDKGTITLRSGKNKISFNRIHESLCKDEKGIKNDI